ncbi:MAG: DMT family transporter [Muribaculaceae bacterium]|nr:DMT family transporter [Muribaculaceae bacterium]
MTQGKKGHSDFWYHVAAFAMILVWGISFLNTRVLLDDGLTPTQIFVIRFAIAYLSLLVVCRFKVRYTGWRDELLFVVCGVAGGSAYFIAENTALELTLISDVAVLVSIAPLTTALMGAIFYRDERITLLTCVGMIIAFIGSVMLALKDGLVWGDSVLGDLLAMLAALVWAFYSMALKRLNRTYTTLFITRKLFFYGVLSALPLLTLQDNAQFSWETFSKTAVWGNLLYLGLVCSMAAYFIWGITVKRIGAVRASNYFYLSPIISMIAAAIWFGERTTIVAYIGCVLILAGVIMAEKFKRKPVN